MGIVVWNTRALATMTLTELQAVLPDLVYLHMHCPTTTDYKETQVSELGFCNYIWLKLKYQCAQNDCMFAISHYQKLLSCSTSFLAYFDLWTHSCIQINGRLSWHLINISQLSLSLQARFILQAWIRLLNSSCPGSIFYVSHLIDKRKEGFMMDTHIIRGITAVWVVSWGIYVTLYQNELRGRRGMAS